MLSNETLKKGVLIEEIEALRVELINIFDKKKDLSRTELLRKSQQLDSLLNQYNTDLKY